MNFYESPELNTLKLSFSENIGLLSDNDNRPGDSTPEDEFDN